MLAQKSNDIGAEVRYERWRDWTLLSLLGVFVVGSVVVFFPDAITTPGASDPFTISVTLAMLGAMAMLLQGCPTRLA